MKYFNNKTYQTSLLLGMDLSKEMSYKSPFGTNGLMENTIDIKFIWLDQKCINTSIKLK